MSELCDKRCPCGAMCTREKGHDGYDFEVPTGLVRNHSHPYQVSKSERASWRSFQERAAEPAEATR